MNCQECREALIDYWGGHLDWPQRQEIERHLSECRTCASDVEAAGLVPYLLRCDQETMDKSVHAVLAQIQSENNARMPAEKSWWAGQNRQRKRMTSPRFAALAATVLFIIAAYWALTKYQGMSSPWREEHAARIERTEGETNLPGDSGDLPFGEHARSASENAGGSNRLARETLEGPKPSGPGLEGLDNEKNGVLSGLTGKKPERFIEESLKKSAVWLREIKAGAVPAAVTGVVTAPRTSEEVRKALEPVLSREIVAVFRPGDGTLLGNAYSIGKKKGLFITCVPPATAEVWLAWGSFDGDGLVLGKDFVARADVIASDSTTALSLLYCGALRDPNAAERAAGVVSAGAQAQVEAMGFYHDENGFLRLLESDFAMSAAPEGRLEAKPETLRALPPGCALFAAATGAWVGIAAVPGSMPTTVASSAAAEGFLAASEKQCEGAEQAFLGLVRRYEECARASAQAILIPSMIEQPENGTLYPLSDGHQILAVDIDNDHVPDWCIHSAYPGLIRRIPAAVAQLSGDAAPKAYQQLWKEF